jgi:EmrB/QacA subfamily drug resistance transporter
MTLGGLRHEAGERRRRLSLLLLCCVQFMVVLDVTVVNVALPAIGEELSIRDGGLHWVISAYAVVFGGFLLVGGRAGDLLGRRRVFLAGTAIFAASSLVCGLAWSQEALLAGRVGQGLGSALVSPTAFAILTASYAEGPERTRALGAWGSTNAAAAAIGALLGGVLTETLGWQAIFLVNVPLAAAALAVAPVLLAESRGRRRRLDVGGASLVTLALVLLVYALSDAPRSGWLTGRTAILVACALGALAVFALRERRSADPLLPRAALRSPRRRAAALAGFFHGGMMLSTFLLLTLALQQVLGLGAIETGLALLAVRGTSLLWARVGVRLVGRLGAPPVLGAGMLAMCAGIATFTGISPDGSYAGDVLPGLLVLGLAIPFLFLSVSVVATAGVRSDDAGATSGLLSTCQWVGGALGVGLASTVAGLGSGPELTAAAGAIADGFWLPLGLGVAGLVVAGRLLRRG